MKGDSNAVSVVIVSFNVCDYLRDCLKSVFQPCGLEDGALEVWVVDNASQDGSPAMVQHEFPQVRLILNDTNIGFSGAANQALRLASGNYVLLLNPDACLVGDSLWAMAGLLKQRPEAGIVGGAVFNPDGSLDPACHRGLPTPFAMLAKAFGLDRLFPNNHILARYNMRWLPPDREARVEAVSGSCMMIRREVLTKIGLLDERFFLYIEDVDLCVRASAAGWDVYYHPRARIIHHKGASARQNQALARLAFHQSYLAYYDKHWGQSHPGPVRWLIYLMVFAHIGFDRRLFVTPAETARLFQANRTAG